MDKFRSLPFAMYDLAVYLPGGAVLLIILKSVLRAFASSEYDAISAALMPNANDTIGLVIRSVIWLSASYLTGHLAAFASTYAVEKPVHHYLGYPSAVWLDFEEKAELGKIAEILKKIFQKRVQQAFSGFYRDPVQILVLILQIPAIPIFFMIYKKGAFGFYSPKLPLGLMNDVRRHYDKIGVEIKIGSGTRWEKVVEHHVANNCALAYTRMYNYLVIYGALRLLAFIMLLIMWAAIVETGYNYFNGYQEFDFLRTSFIIMAVVAYAFSVMAFAKFNRRYFEETIMALVLAKPLPEGTADSQGA